MIALTPAKDMFKTICHVAVIAARPLERLQQNPPEVDLFFGSPDEIEIDPQQEWVMVESRNGFYEGHRHTLQGRSFSEYVLCQWVYCLFRDPV